MHLKRIFSAAFLLPPLVLLIVYGTPFHLFLLIAFAIALGLQEFYALAEAKGIKPLKTLGIVGGWILSFALFRGRGVEAGLASAFLIMATLSVLFFVADPKDALPRAAVTVLGVFYVAGLLSFPALLRKRPGGEGSVLSLLLITWMTDTGAFYVGSLLGRRRLCPSVSPQKTVEGFFGGLLGSLLASLVAERWLLGIGFFHALALGLLLGLLGQLGDLAESVLKRSAGTKDSGALIPGHGGLLDVIDSLLFTGPAMYLYLTLAGG
ncbi:MAG: phosphatidate cytidylyltransferase [Candidatus Methylomirabilales bacterium]